MNKLLLPIVFFICNFKTGFTQPGSLDTSFGQKGFVSADLGSPFNYNLGGVKVLQLSVGSFFTIHDKAPLVIKRHTNGSIDSSYGINGYTKFAPVSPIDAALQSNGKIVVLNQGSFALARFNANGNLDSAFGNNGVQVATDFGGKKALPLSLATQKDGKLVVAGYANFGSDNVFAISRYNTDGSLDSSFSDDGKVIINFGNSSIWDDKASAVSIQNDGKIVVGGSTLSDAYGYNFGIVRLKVNGDLDSTFGSDGSKPLLCLMNRIIFPP